VSDPCGICHSKPHQDGCPEAFTPPVSEWHADPPEAVLCPGCRQDLMQGPCAPSCPELARVHRISFDPEGRRAEAALEQVNQKALEAWLRRSP